MSEAGKREGWSQMEGSDGKLGLEGKRWRKERRGDIMAGTRN